MTQAAAPFAHPLLHVPTPAAWIARACASPDVLLIDHANCEKKAASTALALMFAYAEDLELTGKMSRLAREELRHYEQVAKLIRGLGVVPQRLAPGRYAERLRRLVARSEPQREVDLMICGAFIEARSCERFAVLGEAIGSPLRGAVPRTAQCRGASLSGIPGPRAPRRATGGRGLGGANSAVCRARGGVDHAARRGVPFSLRAAVVLPSRARRPGSIPLSRQGLEFGSIVIPPQQTALIVPIAEHDARAGAAVDLKGMDGGAVCMAVQ